MLDQNGPALERMGRSSRRLAETRFDQARVIDQVMDAVRNA
jgi:hypothetical protein